jgi:hypothetical protein
MLCIFRNVSFYMNNTLALATDWLQISYPLESQLYRF